MIIPFLAPQALSLAMPTNSLKHQKTAQPMTLAFARSTQASRMLVSPHPFQPLPTPVTIPTELKKKVYLKPTYWTAPTASTTFIYPKSTETKKAQSTTIETLIDGKQVFSKVDAMLDNAKETVVFDGYNLQNDLLYPEKYSQPGTPGSTEQTRIVEKLVKLKNKGLSVKVILDQHFDTEFQEKYNQRTVDYLKAQGVEVLRYPDISILSHVKLLVVDGKFAMIGGMNFGNHSPTNHDAAVFIEGPDVHNLYNKIFKQDWETAGGDPTAVTNYPEFKQGKVKVLTTSAKEAVGGPSDDIYQEIMKQIGNAKESIFAELFVLTEQNIINSLIMAHRRLKAKGKEGVKLLIDPGIFFEFSNTRSGVQKLALAGIPIRFYKSDRNCKQKLHAKWALFDQKTLLIGSANWSNAGLRTIFPNDTQNRKSRFARGNHEADVLIESRKLAKAFFKQFIYDWRNVSFPILTLVQGKWQAIKPNPNAVPTVQNEEGVRLA